MMEIDGGCDDDSDRWLWRLHKNFLKIPVHSHIFMESGLCEELSFFLDFALAFGKFHSLHNTNIILISRSIGSDSNSIC